MPKKEQALKVAFIGHKRVPSREGGVEIVVEELSTRMAKRGIDVTLYNRKGNSPGAKKTKCAADKNYNGVKIKHAITIDKKGLAAVTSSLFAGIGAAFSNYNVVHFHAEGPCAALWIPKLFGKKCIATIHGLDHKRAKWGKFASFYIKFGEKCAVRYADEIIVLSENVKDYFLREYGRETVFIPNGVNTVEKQTVDIIEKELGLTEQEYILFLARLVPEKGIEYLINAFKNVKTTKKLVIAGAASDTEEYAKYLYSIAQDDDRIKFIGFVEGKKLEELYSNDYIYVLPSDLEGMPLSLLEAMSYGNCCLVSDIPECTQVIGDMGVSFKKGSTKDLTDKLQFLCDNEPEVLRYRNNSAKYITEKYNWDDVVNRTLKLYGVENLPQKEKVSARG